MKATVFYSTGRWYGNDSGTPDYRLDVAYRKPRFGGNTVDLKFAFAQPVGGRGVNWENRGWVTGASLELSPEEARRMAVSILWQLEQETPAPITLAFGTYANGAALTVRSS